MQAPAAPIAVPAGCLEDLTGHYQHADATFQYDATDDGGTLTLRVSHLFTPDAGPRYRLFGAPRADAGAVVDAGSRVAPAPAAIVTLQRTPAGFVGDAVAQVPHPVGRTCQARWKTEVLSCTDGGLTIRSQSEVALSDVCQPPVNPQPTLSLDHPLIRVR